MRNKIIIADNCPACKSYIHSFWIAQKNEKDVQIYKCVRCDTFYLPKYLMKLQNLNENNFFVDKISHEVNSNMLIHNRNVMKYENSELVNNIKKKEPKNKKNRKIVSSRNSNMMNGKLGCIKCKAEVWNNTKFCWECYKEEKQS